MTLQIISRWVGQFLCALASVAIIGAILSSAGIAAPYRPSDDAEILERLTKQDDAVSSSLRSARAALRVDPRNLTLALSVARQYIGLGRAEGDPRYYGYAQAALGPWFSRTKTPVEVLVLRAVLRQAGHDFDGALSDLDQVLKAEPRHLQAWLSRAVILQVQGHYAEAVSSCQQLGSRVDPIISKACINASNSLNGRAEESYAVLSDALVEAANGNPQQRVWVLTILGEIAARRGDADASEAHFREALSTGKRNTYLIGALADLLLDEKRFEEVRDLLKSETQSDPLLLRLALAETAVDGEKAADYRVTLEARFAASRRRGDMRHLREETRFTLELLNRPADALSLALENWQTQREPWDARLVLAAALAAGKAEAAKPILNWLEERNLESVQIAPLVAALREERG